MAKAREPISEVRNSTGSENVDDVESSFRPWRVFVNQIDSYHGKKLADFIPEQLYHSSKFDGSGDNNEEEEEDEEEEAGAPGAPELPEDEGINEEVDTGNKTSTEMVRKYEVVGTLMDNQYPPPEDVSIITGDHDRGGDQFLKELMKCGVIVYDITQDASQIAEAQWALEAIAEELKRMASEKPKAFKRSTAVRHFILISTVMTWAMSKPLYTDDPDLAFTEADYRKRKPHANFKDHNRCEKDVVTVKKFSELKDKLKTMVLCCGVTYGDEEGPFHQHFKMAWHNAPELPIFGRGNNEIPVLHVRNIPKIVLMLLRDWPVLRYVVAVEHVRMSQKTIVKKISQALTTGKVKRIPPEEAFLIEGVTQNFFDTMTLNLKIEPAYLADHFMDWHTDLPFAENTRDIVREYKLARNLNPVKIVVLGPPASGKSRLAKTLVEHYQLHYVHVKSLITETINKLTNDIEAKRNARNLVDGEAAGDSDDDDEDEINDEEEADGPEIWQEELEEIQRNLAQNQGRLDDKILNKIFLKKLMSKECQNQGYVMDGYPKTLHQAKELFGNDDEENEPDDEENEDEEEDGTGRGFKAKIMPELVTVLVATDEFLTERLLNLSETEVQGTHYEEEHVIRRFREYRERNTDDNTPLQFFDELEVHPLFISLEDDDPCPKMFPSFSMCLKKIGKPRNYGPTAEELADIRRRNEAESKAAEVAENERRVLEELNRKTQREQKMMEWTNLLEKLKEEEENQLCIMGEPLRHYLVKYVFPTLTQGLVNVAELRPDDPVDYLAEYLFKENPEGKMFEPDYTETMSMLLAAIEEFQKDILPPEELDKGEEKYLKQQRLQHGRKASREVEEEEEEEEEEKDEEVSVDCPYYQTSAKSESTKAALGAESFKDELQ